MATDFGHLLQEFIKNLCSDVYEKIGWDPAEEEGMFTRDYPKILRKISWFAVCTHPFCTPRIKCSFPVETESDVPFERGVRIRYRVFLR